MIDKIFMVLLFVIMLAACESDEQLPFKTAKEYNGASGFEVQRLGVTTFL